MKKLDKDEVLLLFQQAEQLWGKDFQILMAIEEMAELTQELIHYLRDNKKVTYENFVGEVADVLIMIEQIQHMFNINEMVAAKREEKLIRLRGMIRIAKLSKQNK